MSGTNSKTTTSEGRHRRWPAVAVVVGVAIVGVWLALRFLPGAGPPALNGSVRAKVAPNVVMITLDTLRSDRLSCYGSKKVDTPNIDSFATEGVRFTNAAARCPSPSRRTRRS